MKYVLITEGRVNSITPEFDPVFPGVPIYERYHPDFLAQCVAVSDDTAVESGWLYDEADGTFSAPPEPEPIPELTPADLRKLAYETEPVIEWDGELITVNAAATLWTYYAAEDSEKAAALTALIADAKAAIRGRYPDD